jgi:hypothetical protein
MRLQFRYDSGCGFRFRSLSYGGQVANSTCAPKIVARMSVSDMRDD